MLAQYLASLLFMSIASSTYCQSSSLLAIQLYEKVSISSGEDAQKLDSSVIKEDDLSASCKAKTFLSNAFNTGNSSIMLKSIILTGGTIHWASSKVNQNKLVLVFNASFPVKSNESGIVQEAITKKIVAVEMKAYLLNNFTRAFCSIPRCTKDPICIEKMTSSDILGNVKTWRNVVNNFTASNGCRFTTDSSSVHEGMANMTGITLNMNGNTLAMDTTASYEFWSKQFPESFFTGIANVNATLVGISMRLTYKRDEPGPEINWWFTTDGLVSLTLMGIFGFNVIVIIFALLFCACNRTKKAFEMEIWDFAESLATKKKEEEFLP